MHMHSWNEIILHVYSLWCKHAGISNVEMDNIFEMWDDDAACLTVYLQTGLAYFHTYTDLSELWTCLVQKHNKNYEKKNVWCTRCTLHLTHGTHVAPFTSSKFILIILGTGWGEGEGLCFAKARFVKLLKYTLMGFFTSGNNIVQFSLLRRIHSYDKKWKLLLTSPLQNTRRLSGRRLLFISHFRLSASK